MRRLKKRGLDVAMRTVSVSALRYVITAVGPTHLIPSEEYRVLVTLEDTLGILRDELRIEDDVRSHATRTAFQSPDPTTILNLQNWTMDAAIEQLKRAKPMVARRLAKW